MKFISFFYVSETFPVLGPSGPGPKSYKTFSWLRTKSYKTFRFVLSSSDYLVLERSHHRLGRVKNENIEYFNMINFGELGREYTLNKAKRL